ncbi:MAG TPA: hypothetical protein VML19_12770 [Verrucomicrobiae bacterium]|nr:hypothetical protein [Verrucomicrobiae bacterium]
MSRILSLCALLTAFVALASAETFTGRLVDANCYDQQTEQKNIGACVPTTSTSSFALFASGKLYKFDEEGNTKAAAAIKDRADRSADPSKPPSATITVKVTGSMDQANKLKVETIEVQ